MKLMWQHYRDDFDLMWQHFRDDLIRHQIFSDLAGPYGGLIWAHITFRSFFLQLDCHKIIHIPAM